MKFPKIGEMGMGRSWVDLSKVEIKDYGGPGTSNPEPYAIFYFTSTAGNLSERAHLSIQAEVMDDLAEQWLAGRGLCVVKPETIEDQEIEVFEVPA